MEDVAGAEFRNPLPAYIVAAGAATEPAGISSDYVKANPRCWPGFGAGTTAGAIVLL